MPPPTPVVAHASPPPPIATTETMVQASGAFSMGSEQIEKIVREQSAEIIEAVVWKVIPELAKQIIERELNKLLKEKDSHP
jgi:hypothetical protein